MKRTILFLALLSILMLLSACGTPPAQTATETPIPTVATPPTLDLCSSGNLPAVVKPLNDLTRQFDDYVALGSNTPQSQLVQIIPSMQTIRRNAEDQAVPACLAQLKKLQLIYMDTYIQTFLAFESNASSNVLDAGVSQAKQDHTQYVIELARLLGATLIVPTQNPNAQATSTLEVTPSSAAPTVVNPGPNPLNLHVSASLTSQIVGSMPVGASAVAIGRSDKGDWILIQLPGQNGGTAWVYTTLIKFSGGDINSLPLATPTP